MTYANTEYLIDTLVMNAFVKDDITKVAQSSVMTSIAQGIKNYVLSLYDPNKPVASVVAFLGPGLLFRAGFPMLAIFYEVAEALGFDWIGFWKTVGDEMQQFLQAMLSSNQKPSEEDLSNKVDSVVQNAAAEHFKEQPSMGKLMGVMRKVTARQDLKNVIELKAIINKYQQDKKIIREAGLFGGITSKLSRFFIRAIKWIIKTAFVSLGFAAGGGAISSLINGTKSNSEQRENEELPSSAPISIPMAKTIPQDLLAWHNNDIRSIWVENGDINQVPNIILKWIVSVYPVLNNYVSDIKSSNSFNAMLQKFMSRNKMAQGLGIFSIPHPYQRKIDIVNQIVSNFLQEHPLKQSNSHTEVNI